MSSDRHVSELLELLRRRLYNEVDRISRAMVSTFKEKIFLLSQEGLWRLINGITGGLGYTAEDRDVTRLIIYGSYIAWAEAVKPGSRVLEIGTGLGRTCYSVLSTAPPSLYLTIDSSPEILAIALYRNPYPPFQEALRNPVVKLCLCDATIAVRHINDSFDHIIHDGWSKSQQEPHPIFKNPLERLGLSPKSWRDSLGLWEQEQKVAGQTIS